MLLTASRTSPRAKILQSHPTGSTALPSGATLLQSRCSLQTRGLCFGAWSMYLGSGANREGRRHPRAVRYRYMESLNRNISWDNNSSKTIKKAMAALHRASNTSNGKNYVNVDEVKSWSDEFSGARPGKNIEDVERGAIDHLIRGDRPLNYEYDMWKSPLHNIRSYLESQRESQTNAQAAAESDNSTFIDPITNRRATKRPSNKSPLYEDLGGYRATHFTGSSDPVNPSPKYDDLNSYGPVMDQASPEKAQSAKYTDLNKYGPVADGSSRNRQQNAPRYGDLDEYSAVRWNEPDGLRKTTSEEASKQYKDLGKYSTTKIDKPDTARKLSPEEQSKVYHDLDKYQPVEWNEPDGLQNHTKEELSKSYDDLENYGAVRWNEPDGLRKPTTEELSKDYDDLEGYAAVRWSEPDGLRRSTPEELSKNYKDLGAYDTPFVAKRSTIRAHAAAQMDATPKGEPLAAKVDGPLEDLTTKYEDLDKYGPVRWNEPDGLRKKTPEELSKNYEDLHLYGAAKWNEPDGLRTLTSEEKSREYHDVPLYAPRDFTGPEVIAQRIHPEEASKDYKDLPAYHHYDNADSKAPRVHPEEASKKYADLAQYSAYDNNGPELERIHPEQASKEYEDLSKYPTVGFEEATNTEQVHPEELAKTYEDLDKYKPTTFDQADTPYPTHPEDATKTYKDLHRYSAVRHNEPDGKPASQPDTVARGLGEFDSKAGSQDTRNGPLFAYPLHHRTNRFDSDSIDSNADSLTAQEIRAATLRRARESSQEAKREEFQGPASMDSSEYETLTGNYVRDFPEEFSTSWSTENSSTKSTLLPKDQAQESGTQATSVSADPDSVEVSSLDESFPSLDDKLQTALDRHRAKMDREMKDLYSHEPQGLETSFAEECGGKATLPTLEKHYETKGPTSELPASYKILAYDGASQTISIAEATTTIPEADPASTLSDVLLRLSNPSKFLPHFESLQAQGYEVVSGSGDVLIFRKVREVSEDSVKHGSTGFAPTRVNPIDMMGKSAIGNFASPTGFVNYDALSETAEKPAPPFQPAPDVGHDDSFRAPVKGRKKRRIGRKLVLGTAGLAGSAYAVATMGEYFSTKGIKRDEPKQRRL
ncbi:hypothetical protein AK830_g10053 [Neonectria ditissima]|uniref:Uncharacterized protein n=1 Tax=Neonectria ditissima TaxID=78410 RepID=A0A0P7BB82_9HYPO|nr:hypothetical protein AK830_g10053 [Neonectria ditissima]